MSFFEGIICFLLVFFCWHLRKKTTVAGKNSKRACEEKITASLKARSKHSFSGGTFFAFRPAQK